MSKPPRIAFIGSRDIEQFDPEWLTLYEAAVRRVVKNGAVVVTGAARGCDQLAARAALEAGGQVELVLPWASYEADWVGEVTDPYPDQVSCVIYDPETHGWDETVTVYHPTPGRLSSGARALHARNFGIVGGASCVVALPGIVRPGGTAQGIRIAEALKIPVYNLATARGRDDLWKRLKMSKATPSTALTVTCKVPSDYIPTFPEE